MATMALDFTKPHVLRNAREHDAAVAEIDRLLDTDAPSGTEEYDRLKFLSVLVQAYEDQLDPLEAIGTPRNVVDFMLEQRGMSRTELTRAMGGRARVSQFFSGKRPLSIGQIQKLRALLKIPADLLIARAKGSEKPRRVAERVRPGASRRRKT